MKDCFNRVGRVALLCFFLFASVTFAQSDVTSPKLTAFSFSPQTINTSTSGATVSVSVSATDDLSGLRLFNVVFRSPSGQAHTASRFFQPGQLQGTATGSAPFPQYSEVGNWIVQSVDILDQVGNENYLEPSDLTAAGFSTVLKNGVVVPPSLNFIGSVAHLAAEENWTTTLTLLNKTTGPPWSNPVRLNLFGDISDPGGNGPLALPLTFPQGGIASLVTASLDETILVNHLLIIDTAGPQTPPVLVGSAQLASTGAVDGFAIFHQIVTGQEAVVPLETRNANSYLLVFDNTNTSLGVAVDNVSAQFATIPVIIRDDAGVIISPVGTTISLGGNAHTSFVLSVPDDGKHSWHY